MARRGEGTEGKIKGAVTTDMFSIAGGFEKNGG